MLHLLPGRRGKLLVRGQLATKFAACAGKYFYFYFFKLAISCWQQGLETVLRLETCATPLSLKVVGLVVCGPSVETNNSVPGCLRYAHVNEPIAAGGRHTHTHVDKGNTLKKR